MLPKSLIIKSAAVAVACIVASDVAFAQAKTERTVEEYTCKDVMREGGAARDIAIAFLHGYMLGQSGASKFNLEVMERQTDAFMERCLDNPGETAQNAMSRVKN